jgi:hypothetical protein
LDLQGQNLEEWKVGIDIALGKGDETVIIVNGFNNTLGPSTQRRFNKADGPIVTVDNIIYTRRGGWFPSIFGRHCEICKCQLS